MFGLDIVAYPGSKGTFFFNYPLSTKRLEVSYHILRTEEYPDYTWKIDLIFKLIISNEQKTLERSVTLLCPFSDTVVLCFGKEPIARDHFVDIDPDFPLDLLGPLKGKALIDVSTNHGNGDEDLAYFSSKWLKL